MAEFDWAANNLDVGTLLALQARGVHVFRAPQVAAETKVVDLADGHATAFAAGQEAPAAGLYADYDGLVRYCRKAGLPFVETDGQVSILPSTTHTAGDPLAHGEAEPLEPNPSALHAPSMGNHPAPDPAGARGGDTGSATQVGHGPQAEKGDERRDPNAHTGQTRDGKADGIRGKGGHRSGSQSNPSR